MIDADGLKHFITNKDSIDISNSNFIFTPNVKEFERLYGSYFKDYLDYKPCELEELLENGVNKLTEYFNSDDEILYFNNEDLKKIECNFYKREIDLSKALKNQIIVKKVLINL